MATGNRISNMQLRPLWLVLGWMLVLLIIYESLTPDPIGAPPVEQGDKLMHVAAYLVLMSWFANLYERSLERIVCVASCIALGVGLEFAQRWGGIRSFEYADMAADAAGVIIAWLVAPPRLPNYLLFTENVIHACCGPKPGR
jgi:VanZ family protein